MNGELTAITINDLQALTHDLDPDLIAYAQVSSPLLAGRFGDQRVFIIGLVAQSFVSAQAYIWLQVLPYTGELKLPPFSARYAKQFVADALNQYPIITGHCNTPVAIRWWAALGATFTPIRDDIYQFEIR